MSAWILLPSGDRTGAVRVRPDGWIGGSRAAGAGGDWIGRHTTESAAASAVRPRGVWHQHLLAGAITELEMFDRCPAFRVPHETDMLVREGFVAIVDGAPVLTAKGIAERQRERALDDPKAKK